MSSREVWAIFDTETTGLIVNDLRPLHKQPRVIEIAAVLLEIDPAGFSAAEIGDGYYGETAREIAHLDMLIDPGVRIDDVITKVTGIKNADLVGKPKWSDVALEVQQFFDQADGYACHNAHFDRRMVAMEMARIGRVMLWPDRVVCTVECGEGLWGKRVKLAEMHTNLFGVGFEGAHRAISDVRATGRCFAELKRRSEV